MSVFRCIQKGKYCSRNGCRSYFRYYNCTSFITNVLDKLILQQFDITYLRTIVFILVIAALVQFVEMFMKKSMPPLYNALGIFLPLITTNCAVLGVALNNVQYGYGIGVSTINGFATAVGFTIQLSLCRYS